MPRRISKKTNINLDSILNDISFFIEPVVTNYKEIDFGSHISYEFESESNLIYLNFYYSKYNCDIILTQPNGKLLGNIIGGDCDSYELIDCFEVDLSFIGDEDLNTIDLFPKLMYILKKLITQYRKIRLFVIKDISETNIEYFKLILGESFFDYFDLIFSNNIMFLVRKK
jgi:hypothetical protein